MQLFYQENITPPNITLDAEESRHLVKVLRKRVGDSVEVTDGKGTLHHCKVSEIGKREATLQIENQTVFPKSNHFIHLVIAPTKSPDRMEWLVEKAAEIGFDELSLIQTENSERSRLKLDRLEKKVVSACKQSLKYYFPRINDLKEFSEFLDNSSDFSGQKFIAYVDDNHTDHLINLAKPSGEYMILIGPEGDFTPKEINLATESGFAPVSLGSARLRTETAGLASVHILQLIQEQK
ncbi:16S rRNA (uracil(1498)-N(3))-methyltransferase [Algoriphagus sediminis]|uniref:Ribosomal RNA small subunit methyltransferase E n=1 Tax=Algoriphagus sediminis TaxID=3057113 RepID=A0ABT7YAH6_9BACT|nr:16S rRNA (uracil(1498)-N(3))-methyltransferase [Algoriphagus sediminis]MDN3203441.1 16S rRNA (uracil(1498)-N(3))-methyltransferase [Algoriphagus sediminis]